MKKLTFLILTLATTLTFHAQVAINVTGNNPDGSAMLDVQSATAGILIPRMVIEQRNAINNPATGLLVFVTNDNKFYYYNGTIWVVIAADSNPVFERNGTTIRQVAHYDDDFIIGRDALPANGESITDTLLFFDKSKAAFRAGILDNSKSWSPDSIGYGSVAFGKDTKAKGLYSAVWGYYNKATGNYSTAWGYSSLATGNYSTAWGGCQATGDHSTAWGGGSLATGNYSTAWGYYSQATGRYSTAWGYADATGNYSTAWGYNANATGNYSTVWGYDADATGNHCTVFGVYTTAKSYNETALGQYNTNYTPNSTDSWNANDRLFQIGNGTSSSARSNALTIYKNGNTVIGRDTMPANGDTIFGKFLFFQKYKGSFRGGSLYSSANWSPDSIGIASFAYGYNTKAKGHYSTAMGAYSDASGYISAALGQHTFAPSAFETSFGSYNTNYTPNSTTVWNSNDRLFSVGNGTSGSARSNALSIYKNGNVAIGNTIPEATAALEVSSTTKGFLPPRMTNTQMEAMSSPAEGLMIYNTDFKNIFFYTGSNWIKLNNSDGIAGDPINYGNQIYQTVIIGDQIWMAENLNIGTMIPGSNNQNNSGSIEKYCYNDLPANCDTYGGLYQWDEIMQYVTTEGTQGICPPGWHIPTDTEWQTLEMHLGMTPAEAVGVDLRGSQSEGGKLKEIGITHWNSPNTSASNLSGFTALSGGYRHNDGSFHNLGNYGTWWSSSEGSDTDAWLRFLDYDDGQIGRNNFNKTRGRSVRCLKN